MTQGKKKSDTPEAEVIWEKPLPMPEYEYQEMENGFGSSGWSHDGSEGPVGDPDT